MSGILPGDLCVIGAPTGEGKSSLAIEIAKANVKLGNRVVFFALEAYEGEIEDRLKWQKICRKYYSQNSDPISFRGWKLGNYKNSNIETIEKEAIEENVYSDRLLFRYTNSGDYNVENFQNELLSLICQEKIQALEGKEAKKTDLVIIDHLHYFDYGNEKESSAVRKITKTVRDMAITYKLPIILISHLRKKNPNSNEIIPDIHEFHGSSEITKRGVTIITMSPAWDIEQTEWYLHPTYFRICKDRFDSGAFKRTVICQNFDFKSRTYEDNYDLYKLTKGGTQKEKIMSDKKPFWARHMKSDYGIASRYKGKSSY